MTHATANPLKHSKLKVRPLLTTAPVSPLARLMAKSPSLPPPTTQDRERWRQIAVDRSPVKVTEEAPDVSIPVQGLIECAPPESFRIGKSTAAWFFRHGGERVVRRALQKYIRERKAEERPSSKAAIKVSHRAARHRTV